MCEYYKDFITEAKKDGREYAHHQIQWVNDNYPKAFQDVDLDLVKFILNQYVFFPTEEKAVEFAKSVKPPQWLPTARGSSESYKRLRDLWYKNGKEARLRAIALYLLLQ